MLNCLFSKIKIAFDPTSSFRLLYRHRNLLRQLVLRNVASRYRGSILGMMWSLLFPLLMLTLYTFVFSIVFQAKFGSIPNDNKLAFALILFSGMACYNLFSEGVSGCCCCVTGNPNYVKKVVFPLEILPVAQLLSSVVLACGWLILLLLGIAVLGAPFHFSWTVLLLPLTVAPLLLLTGGIGFFVASLAVFVRDLQQVVGIVLQILFFLTPIFYPVSAVPKEFRFLLQFNPLSPIVEQTRELLLFGRQPNYGEVLMIWIVAFAVFQLGYVWFVRTKRGFADVL